MRHPRGEGLCCPACGEMWDLVLQPWPEPPVCMEWDDAFIVWVGVWETSTEVMGLRSLELEPERLDVSR